MFSSDTCDWEYGHARAYLWKEKILDVDLLPPLLRLALLCTYIHQVSWPWTFVDYPLSISHFTIGLLGLQTQTTLLAFIRALRMLIPSLIFMKPSSYMLSHFPNPSKYFNKTWLHNRILILGLAVELISMLKCVTKNDPWGERASALVLHVLHSPENRRNREPLHSVLYDRDNV